MTYIIRKATIVDFNAVLPLFEAFYREEGFDHAVSRVAPNLRQILERDDTAVFVAEEGGKTVGAAALSTSFGLAAGYYAELEDLYVVPARRGEGIARDLVEGVCDWAREAGCHDVEIVVTEHGRDIAGLLPFYKGMGFEETGRMIMERAL